MKPKPAVLPGQARARAMAGRIGAAVRAARKARGHSIRSAARALRLSPRFVHQLEQGKPGVRLDKVCQALDALDLELVTRAKGPPMPSSEMPGAGSGIVRMRLDEARQGASRKAAAVLGRLAAAGVRALVFGSLAKGTFREGSDVDFLVLRCPARLKYRIESLVEDLMGAIPFDVVYADEMPPALRARARAEAIDESGLRPPA
jgi:transcriptional regulator with XRE-family HTH domain